MKNFNKGFTLIELLIVIALLGALAVGLLAALDPFEQLKKGTDTGIRNTVAELHGAVVRYYGIKNYMPWCTLAACTAYRDGDDNVLATPILGSAWTTTITEIESAGELKSGFSTIAGSGAMAKITIFGANNDAAAGPSIEVCYKPTAKSFINDPSTKYVATTGVEAAAGTCKGQGGADLTCLWCIK
jgi:prepilin-type N-terminal cleavage/methylation domain-containing protein